jgi:oxygen-independent coproporphyrinogen-3 oxidase
VKPRHLYIHVPFCARRCAYCDFAVEARRDPPVEAWLDAIAHEMGGLAAAEEWAGPLDLDTVYVGGGTPSLLGVGVMAALRARLAPLAHWGAAAEWTVEANPESFTAALAGDWYAAGVNRVSLGVQTFHAPSLRWMGRLHGSDGPARAVLAARAAGLENIGVDLIFGLPRHLRRDWARDLDEALALGPEHISLYGLTAEPATPLGRWVGEGRVTMAGEERYAEEYELAARVLPGAGFHHYEVSNFAVAGRSSRHNAAYWSAVPYVGLGPGAHSFIAPRRWWNVRAWEAYRGRVAGGGSPREGFEEVDGASAALERLWLGLRTQRGLAGDELTPGQRAAAARWADRGLSIAEADRLRLTPAGWLLLDRLALDLYEAA